MKKYENYDAVEYWNEKKWPTERKMKKEMFEKFTLSFIRDNIKECKNILDFGPGVGRIFPLYKDAISVNGYDVSDKWKNIITEEAKKYKFKFDLTIVKEIVEMPYKDKQFDVAIAMSVFLHQKPENIEFIMKDLVRVSKKVVVGTYWDETKEHNKRVRVNKWNYDYKMICEKNGWEMFNRKYGSTEAWSYFVYKEK